MEKISAKNFKKKYLYFDKKYMNNSLCNFLNMYDDKLNMNNLTKSIGYIFPYINDNDIKIFISYIKKSNIEFSNRLNLYLDKNVFIDYLNTLSDEKIKVDIIRLNFTTNFVHKCNAENKKISKLKSIDTKNLLYLDEDSIYYHNFKQIKNKTKFLDNILKSNKFFKYLLHQDIHNSILNPILISIMLSKYFKNKETKNPTIIQLRDILQIYKDVNKKKSKIEMVYMIKKYFILDPTHSDAPIEYRIDPYLIIKYEMQIQNNNNIIINVTY